MIKFKNDNRQYSYFGISLNNSDEESILIMKALNMYAIKHKLKSNSDVLKDIVCSNQEIRDIIKIIAKD